MPQSFGYNFQPGTEQNGNGLSRTANPRQAPVQEAIQVLSLRLPKVFGAATPVAPSLLTAPGGMGQPAARGNVVAQALAQLAGLPSSMAFPPTAAPMLSAPSYQGAQQQGSAQPGAYTAPTQPSASQAPPSPPPTTPLPVVTFPQQAPSNEPPPYVPPSGPAPSASPFDDFYLQQFLAEGSRNYF